MATATVRWLNDRNFVGVDSTGHSVVLSGQKNGIGVSPSQMLLVALAACSSVDVVEILEKKRKKLTLLEVTANGEQDPDPPWTYRRIHVTYRLGGKDLTAKAVEQAIQLSEEKYCSVAATVRGVAKITTEYEIVSEEPA
ncbi:MAG: OsmC family protein [Desulfobacterales bacterium]|nr:OsmC family protein [Desulfobacterales bacterium]